MIIRDFEKMMCACEFIGFKFEMVICVLALLKMSPFMS